MSLPGRQFQNVSLTLRIYQMKITFITSPLDNQVAPTGQLDLMTTICSACAWR